MVDAKLINMMKSLLITDNQFVEVYTYFCAHLRMGLSLDTHDNADTKCYITYVHNLPTGTEVGKSLALDLGGTNFRVLLITLNGQEGSEQDSKVYPLSTELKTGQGGDLFDYIAECLDNFVRERRLEDERLPLGFTFSFPCQQMDLQQAKLVKWTKGFTCSNVEGEDVGHLLREAIARRTGLKIDVIAILNDTTGTLISCAHKNPNCRIGVIVGTGTNACYYESVKCVERLEPELKAANTNVIINIEWGAFGDGGCLDFIRTVYDLLIDEQSPNHGQQLFEKMCSGMYLGELMRLTLIDAIKGDMVFAQESRKGAILDFLIDNKDCFETRILSEIETDRGIRFEATKKALTELFEIDDISDEDCRAIRFMCECVTKRSAYLIGVALSALINKINEPRVVVAIDGSVYRFHPKFDALLREKMRRFVNPKLEFDIMLSEDGSGRGAALVAAVAAEKAAI